MAELLLAYGAKQGVDWGLQLEKYPPTGLRAISPVRKRALKMLIQSQALSTYLARPDRAEATRPLLNEVMQQMLKRLEEEEAKEKEIESGEEEGDDDNDDDDDDDEDEFQLF